MLTSVSGVGGQVEEYVATAVLGHALLNIERRWGGR
jgi:hypothetical protein